MRRGTSPLVPARGVLLDRQLNYSRDSPVSTATRFRAKNQDIFLSSKTSRRSLDPLGFLFNEFRGSFPGVITLD